MGTAGVGWRWKKAKAGSGQMDSLRRFLHWTLIEGFKRSLFLTGSKILGHDKKIWKSQEKVTSLGMSHLTHLTQAERVEKIATQLTKPLVRWPVKDSCSPFWENTTIKVLTVKIQPWPLCHPHIEGIPLTLVVYVLILSIFLSYMKMDTMNLINHLIISSTKGKCFR